MKLTANISCKVLFPLFTTLLFVSCTIMDNDLRDLPNNPAYREVVHEEGEGWKADYQYQPWTVLLDERYYGYIHQMDYVTMTLYLHDYIPDDMLPTVGNVLAANPSEKIEWGLAAKVVKVSREGQYYAIETEKAGIDEVFLDLVYEQAGDYEFDFGDEGEESNDSTVESSRSVTITRADDSGLIAIPYDDPESPYWYREDNHSRLVFDGNKLWDNIGYAPEIANVMGKAIPEIHKTFGKESVLTFNIDAKFQFDTKIKPMTRIKQYYNKKENKVDVYIAFGGSFEAEFMAFGSAKLNVNIWKLLKLPQPKPIWVGAPIGLPIFFQLKFGLDLYAQLKGQVNVKAQKYWDAVIGYRKNIPGKEEGPYVIQHNPNMTFYPGQSWDLSGSALSLFFDAGISLSMEPSLVIGVPDIPELASLEAAYREKLREKIAKEGGIDGQVSNEEGYPNVKLSYKPSIGFDWQMSTGADTRTHTYWDKKIDMFVPLNFAELNLTLNFWKGFTYKKNLVDLILSSLGYKQYQMTRRVKVWEKTLRFYPSIDNPEISCTNAKETGTPEFLVGFNVNDVSGLDGLTSYKPLLRIMKDNEEVLVIDDFQWLKTTDKGKHFTRTIKDSKLKRDVVYTLRIEMVEPIVSVSPDVPYSSGGGMPFTTFTDYWRSIDFSTSSPSCQITSHEFTRCLGYFKKLLTAKEPYGNPSLCDWTFRTKLNFIGYRDIKKVGFYIGSNRKKKWECDMPPASEKCDAIWAIEKYNKIPYTLEIYPYVETKGGSTITWPEPYILKCSYTELKHMNNPNLGGEGKPYYGWTDIGRRKSNGVSYYVFGFDNGIGDKSATDLTTNEKSRAAIRDDGTTEYYFVIAPEDLE